MTHVSPFPLVCSSLVNKLLVSVNSARLLRSRPILSDQTHTCRTLFPTESVALAGCSKGTLEQGYNWLTEFL
jgi:hypothetical protein